MVRGRVAGVDRRAQPAAAGEDVDWHRRRARTRTAAAATRTPPDRRARSSSITAMPVTTGRKRPSIGDVNLATAAGRPRVLLERRLEDQRRGRWTPGRPRALSAAAKRSPCTHGAPTSSNGRVVPRPSDAIVPSSSTVPGKHDGAVERRDVRRRHHPRRDRSRPRRVDAASPPSSRPRARAPMPKCSLKSRASSPIVMPWRIGIGNWPTNDSKPGIERRALDLDAADRVRAIADDRPAHRAARRRAGSWPSCRCRCRCACRCPAGR